MFITKSKALVVAAGFFIALGGLVAKGSDTGAAQDQPKKEVKKVPLSYTRPDSGSEMFKQYCAVCHGPDGKGDGPAVEFLKNPPPNLRTLAKGNNGKFPEDKVSAVLKFGSPSHAHGTLEMPLWGPLFRARDGSVSELRVANLAKYVGTLQDK